MNSNRKSIAIVGNSLLKGGSEKQSILLCRLLSEYYNPFLVVLDGKLIEASYKEYLDKNNCKYYFLTGNIFYKVYIFIKILLTNRTTVIISYLLRGNFFAGIIGRIIGIDKIYGGIRSSVLVRNKLVIQRLLHRYFQTYTITNNYSSLEYLVKNKFNPDRLIYIPNIIEKQPVVPNFRDRNKFGVLTVCRFDESKDLITALKAFEIFLNSVPNKDNVTYNIVGYGEYEQNLREWIRKSNLEKYVSIIINPENVNQYYREASLYLSASKQEGLSNSILEAMSFSLPIVATKAGDNYKLISHGINGYLAEIGNEHEIASYIKMIFEDPEKIERFGKRSIQILSEEYCEEAVLRKYSKLII